MNETDKILTAVRRWLEWNQTFFDDQTMAAEFDDSYILDITPVYSRHVDLGIWTCVDYRIRLSLNDELHWVDLLFTYEDDELKRLEVYADTDYVSCYASSEG